MQDIFANADPGSSFGKSLQRGIVQAEKKLNSANGLLGKEFFSEADLAKTLKQMDGISDILSEIHVLAKGASTKALGFETQELIDSTKALKDFKAQVQDLKKNTKMGAINGMVDKDSVKQMAAMSKTTGFSMGKTFDENYTSLSKSLDTVSKDYLELQLEAQKAKEAMEAANLAAAKAKVDLNMAQGKLDSRKQANVNAAQAVAGISTGVGGASHRTKQNVIDDYKKLLDQQLVNGQWASGGEDFARIIAGWLEVDEGDLTGTATQIVTNLKRSIETAMKKGPISANVLNQNAQNILNGDASALQKDAAYKQTQNEVVTATTAVKTTENAAKNALTTLQAANNNVSQTATLLNTIRTQMAELKQLQAEYNALVDKNSSGRMDQLRQTQADAEKRARAGVEVHGRNAKTGGSTVKAGYDLQGQVQQGRIMEEQQKRLAEESKRESEQFVSNLKQATKRWMGAQQVINLVKRGLRQAYQDIKALDTAMTNIAVVTDMSIQELWGKIDQYMSIAQQYGVTTQGVYEVSQLYYQQGLSTNEVMAATTETLKLARIAGMDYKDAADAMTVAIRSFKMEMDDAQRVTDVYSKVAAITASDSEELAVAMSKTASSAESVGSSFENTTAMLAVMVETTRESAQNLGSALKSIISRYGEMKAGKTTDEDGEAIYYNKVDQALASVGISLKDAQGQFRDFDDVIFELSKKWYSLDKNTQRYIATIMAGNRQQSRFIALVDNWERLDEVSQAAADSADAGLLQYAKTLDSLDTKLNSIKTSFQEFYMSIVNGPVIGGILEAINSLIQGFNKLGTLQGILSLVGIIRGLKTALNLVVNTFSHSFTGIIGSWKNVQTQLLALARTSGAQRGREEANAEIQAYNATIQQGRVAGYRNSQIDLSTGQTTDGTRRRRYQGPSSRTEAVAARQKQAYNDMSWFDKRQYGMQTGKIEMKNNSWGGSKWGQGIAIGGAIGGSIASTWGASIAEDKPIRGALVSGLGNIAQGASIGAMAGPWGALIGGIVGLISSIPAVFNAITNQAQHKLEKLKKEAEELNVTRAQKTDEYKTLSDYTTQLKELSKVRLNSNEDNEAWLALNNEIAEKYPELISYIDAEGNSIVSLTEDYAGLAIAKKEALEASSEYYSQQIEVYKQAEELILRKGHKGDFGLSDFVTEQINTQKDSSAFNLVEWEGYNLEDNMLGLGGGNQYDLGVIKEVQTELSSGPKTFEEISEVFHEGIKNVGGVDFAKLMFGTTEEIESFITEQVEAGDPRKLLKGKEQRNWNEDSTIENLSEKSLAKILAAYSETVTGYVQIIDEDVLSWFSGIDKESALYEIEQMSQEDSDLTDVVNSHLDIARILHDANLVGEKNAAKAKKAQEVLSGMELASADGNGKWTLNEAGKSLVELQKNIQAYYAALRANISSQGSLTMYGTEYAKDLAEMAGAEEILLQRSISMAGGVDNLLDFENTSEFKDIYSTGGYAQRLASWYASLTTQQKELYTIFIERSTSLSLDEAIDYLSRIGIDRKNEFYQSMIKTWYEDNISAQSRAIQKIWGVDAGIQSYDSWLKSEEYTARRELNNRVSKDMPDLYKTDQELYREALRNKLDALKRKETDEEKISIATIIEEASTEELNAFLNFYQETDDLLKGAISTRQKEFLQKRRAAVGKYISLFSSDEWKTSSEEIFGVALKDLTKEQADALSALMLSPNFGTEAWLDEVKAFGNSIGISIQAIDKQISEFMYQNYNTKMEMLLSQIDQTIENSSELVSKQDKGYTFEEAQKKFQELKTLGLTDSFVEVFEITEEGLLILRNVDTALSQQYSYFNSRLAEEKDALKTLLYQETTTDGKTELKGLLSGNGTDNDLLSDILALPDLVVAAEQAANPASAAQADLDTMVNEIHAALLGAGLEELRADEILNTIINYGFKSADEVQEFFLQLSAETGLATDYLTSQFGKIRSDLAFSNFSEQFKSRETASEFLEDPSLDNLRSIWDTAAKDMELDGQSYEIWSQDSGSWEKYYKQKQQELYNNHIGELDAFGNLIIQDWEEWARYIATSQGYEEGTEGYKQIFEEAKLQGKVALESYASSLEDGLTEITASLINNGEIEYSQLQDIIDTLQSRGALNAEDYESLMNAYEDLKNGTTGSYTDFLNQITRLAKEAGLGDFDTSEISAAIRDAYAELISSLANALKDGVEGTLSNEEYTNLARRYGLSGDLRTSSGVSLSAQSQRTMAVEMYRAAQASGSTIGAGEDIWAAFKDAEGSILGTYEDIVAEIERISNGTDANTEEAREYLKVLEQIKAAAHLDPDYSIFAFMEQGWGGAGADTFDSFASSIDKVKSSLQSLKEGEYIDYKDFANMISFLNSSGQWKEFAEGTEFAGKSYQEFVRTVIANTDEFGKVNLEGIALQMGVGIDTAMESMTSSMTKGLKKVAEDQIKYLQGLESMLIAMVALEEMGNIDLSIRLKEFGNIQLDKIADQWEEIKSDPEIFLVINAKLKQLDENNAVVELMKAWGFGDKTFSEMFFGGGIESELEIPLLDAFGTLFKKIGNLDLTEDQAMTVAMQLQGIFNSAFENGHLDPKMAEKFIEYVNTTDWSAIPETLTNKINQELAEQGGVFKVGNVTVDTTGGQVTLTGLSTDDVEVRKDQIDAIEQEASRLLGEKVKLDINPDTNIGQFVSASSAEELASISTDFETLEEAATAVQTAFASLQEILNNFAVSDAFREFVSLVTSLHGGGETDIIGENAIAENSGISLSIDTEQAKTTLQDFEDNVYGPLRQALEKPISLILEAPGMAQQNENNEENNNLGQVIKVTQEVVTSYLEDPNNPKPVVESPQDIIYNWVEGEKIPERISDRQVYFRWIARNPLQSLYNRSNPITVYYKLEPSESASSGATGGASGGLAGPGGWTGTINNISGSAYADGSIGRLYSGAELANKVLVGELGPELAVYDGQYHMLGARGAEFVNLPSDAIIFNHKQTEGILNGQFNIRGTAMAEGNVSGPAYAGGAAGALETVRDAISVWTGLLHDLSVSQLLDKVSKGSGGGSGGSLTAVTSELEEWFNLSKQIEKTEIDINNLIAERNNLLGGEALVNLRKQQQLLYKQIDTYKVLGQYQQAQLQRQKEHILNNEFWKKYFTFDESDTLQFINGNEANGGKGALEILANFNEWSGEEQQAYLQSIRYQATNQEGEQLEGTELAQFYIDELNRQINEYTSLYKIVMETNGTLEDLLSSINDIEQEIKDTTIEVEETIYDSIIEAWELQIEKMEEQADLIEEANKSYIDGLKNALNEEKNMYSSNESIADREALQRRLALLRRSGGSASEIYDLEKQLDGMLKDEYFKNQEKLIENISEANEEQLRRLEEQIKLQEEALEYQQEHGIIWSKVYEILQGETEAIISFIQGNNSDFMNSSLLQQEEMLKDLFDKVGFVKENQKLSAIETKAEKELWNTGIATSGLSQDNLAAFNNMSDKDKEGIKQSFLSSYALDINDGKTHEEALKNAQANINTVIKNISEAAKAKDNEANTNTGTVNPDYPYGKASATSGRIEYTAKGNHVKAIQYALNKLGYGNEGTSDVDGVYGEYTVSAVKKFQKAQGITADGIVGDETREKFKLLGYKQGGLVDYTGPAFVHGSPSKPEAFLNAKQTAMISEAIKTVGDGGALDGIKATLAALNATIKSIVNNNNIQSSSFTVAPGAVTIQVAQLNDSYDVEELSKDVMNRMVAIASKTTNRGVNRR